MVRATSKPSVGQKVSAFFQKVDDKKTVLCPNVLNRILHFSDNRAKCNLGLTCKTTQAFFQTNFVTTEKLWYRKKDKDAPYNAWSLSKETVEKGMVLEYSPVGCAGFESDYSQSGFYSVQKITKAGIHLRRLTNRNKATVGKRKFFIPYVFCDGTFDCVKAFENYNENFHENLSDSWTIVATTKAEFLPMFEEHFAHVMPAWKIKSRGYPKLIM